MSEHYHDHDTTTNLLLEEVIRLLKVSLHQNRQILQVEQANMGYLAQIAGDLNPSSLTGFTEIQEITMVSLSPGNTATFATTPIPATSVPLAANIVWSSSDTTNAPVSSNTADASGLSAIVAFPSAAVVGTVFSLTVSYTNSDATTATQTNSFTIVAAPPADVTGFSPILQVA